ncbi:hypothetical protein LTR37_013733 [Vermiconidia calcicola]|uniref:Uncharacterized protein n=1 Tax=Vermiconidia calcicola TaxID=1690605 RepID=A0ACC3MVM9_9PEZI|nr:hypothetical protein LTR37_013733 [Vermiconidia calcicola]
MEPVALPVEQGAGSTDLQQSPILRLPGEVRNTIYRLCLTGSTPVDVERPMLVRTALLRVCKQIRAEGEGIFYGENSFRVKYIDRSESKYALNWAEFLKEKRHTPAIPKLLIKLEFAKDVERAIEGYIASAASNAQHLTQWEIVQADRKIVHKRQTTLARDMAKIVEVANIPLDRVTLEKPKVKATHGPFADRTCKLFEEIASLQGGLRHTGLRDAVGAAFWALISHPVMFAKVLWKGIKTAFEE